MKKIIALVMILACATSLFAKSKKKKTSSTEDVFTNYCRTIDSNNFIFNAGIGIDDSAFNANSYLVPCISVSAEYTVKCGICPLGFGAFMSYSGNQNKETERTPWYDIDKKVTDNNFTIGVLANWHINVLDELDIYAGPRLGVKFNSKDRTYVHYESGIKQEQVYHDKNTYFYGGAVIGGTWYFTDNIGANVEIGYPVFIKASFNYKL